MKKMLILTNLLWLFLFGFLYFFYYQPSLKSPTAKTCDEFCYNYSSNPPKGLSSLVAQTMADEYDSLYQQIDPHTLTRMTDPNNSRRRLVDQAETKSVWFSVEEIKRFIYEIERSSCNLNCEKVKLSDLGIRFYFARYPDSQHRNFNKPDFDFLDTQRGGESRLQGKKTLFMVPTYSDGTNDIDFDPKWSAKQKNQCNPTGMSKIESFGSGYSATILMPDPNNLQNHGMLCPPDCSGSSF